MYNVYNTVVVLGGYIYENNKGEVDAIGFGRGICCSVHLVRR